MKIAKRFIPSPIGLDNRDGDSHAPPLEWSIIVSQKGTADDTAHKTMGGPLEPVSGPDVLAFMAEQGHENVLTMRALAAQFRAYAAETSLEMFRCKFEATAEELERLAGVSSDPRTSVRKFPDTGSGRGYGH